MSLLTLTFTVRDPIGQNAAYQRSAQGRMFMTKVAKDFKERCAAYAAVSGLKFGWPRNLFRVAHARVSYQLYDVGLDADAPAKLVRDAFEGILYNNDKIVSDGEHPVPIQDGKGPRIEITVELLEVRSNEEAQAERAKQMKREQQNIKRRAQRRQKAKAS